IMTERLILEKGFDAVAVEADWPDASRVRRFIHRVGPDETPEDALHAFQRFPKWMWRNDDVAELVSWLRRHAPHVGFSGLDLYGLHASIAVVVRWLEEVAPRAARRARERYSCLDQLGPESDTFAYGALLGPSCAEDVREQLVETRSLLREHSHY